MSSGLRLVSWNVKGLNHPVKRSKVLSHLKDLKAGVAFLQETHLRHNDHNRIHRGWVGQIFHSSFQVKARGVAILISKAVPFVPSQVIADKNGRYIIVSGKLFNTFITLANVYAPNIDDVNFFRHFFSMLPGLNSCPLIIGGDFNCWLDPVLDRSSSKPISESKSASFIHNFISEYGLSELWRFLHPTEREYSYFSSVHHSYSRIDYFFIDKSMLQNVRSCAYQSIVISDHAPLTLDISLPHSRNTRRHWRLNTTTLAYDDFVKFISQQIDFFLSINKTPDMSDTTVWEALKAFLRGQIISFAADREKISKACQTKLINQIKDLDKQYACRPTPSLFRERLKLKTDFDLLSTQETVHLLQRNRSDFYEHGEKTGKLLASQLRGARAKQSIGGLRLDDGEITSDPNVINSKFRDFYCNLYTSDSELNRNDMEDFLGGLKIPVISLDYRKRLDEPITQEEIGMAISSMQSGKSPGPDGFPAEFYKKFSTQLSSQLAAVFTESFEKGTLPPTMNQACISLLAKSGKDPLDCASYRPISLLNTDVKILAKVLARRLEDALPLVISPDQTGFVKNRHSFFNIRRLLNILYTPSATLPECIVSMDAEKAFDRVEWEYLFTVLEKFGFGPSFINWIKLLYSSPSASVLTNGQYSRPFDLHRGTRQGCPLSPLLFALAIEPLAIAIRDSGDISGVLRGGTEHKVSLYADDLLLYISNPNTSLPAVLALLKKFSLFSGYKLNLHKSELFPISHRASQLHLNVPFKISKNSFTYLGVSITQSFNNLFKANFTKLLEQTKKDLSKWSPLNLTLTGRINSVKMTVLPKFLYLFQCVPVFIPLSFFKSLDSIISSFIWNGKQPRLRKAFLQRPKDKGGMALPNFKFYYWAANIRCMLYWWHYHLNRNCPSWVTMESSACQQTSLSGFMGAALPAFGHRPTNNPVVNNALRVWVQFRKTFGFQKSSILSPIAVNHLFAPSMQDNTFQQWHGAGLHCFKDLFVENTFASFEQMSEKFGLPNSHFFRFLQVRHYVKCQVPSFPSLPPVYPLDAFFSLDPFSKGAVSRLYNLISSLDSPSLATVRTAWEQDLGLCFSDDDWESILRQVHGSSMCVRHSLLQFKVVHRAHLSKVKLSKLYSDISPECDKCKSADASLIHMYWTCPSLEQYWRSVFDTLSGILEIRIEPHPLVALFGVAPEDWQLPLAKQKSLAFASLLARRSILLKWKEPYPPRHTQWVRDLLSCLSLEKIRFTIRGSERKFYKVWGSFLDSIDTTDSIDDE